MQEVLRMVEAGILGEDEPLELIDGELLVMGPQGPRHATAIQMLCAALQKDVASAGHLRVQMPISAGEDSLPEPDLALVVGDVRAYADRHPMGAECLRVVEVALTSQAVDRAKASTYAAAGVPCYWLLDLAARRLEVRTHPHADGRYGVTTVLDEGEGVEAPGSGRVMSIDSLLP